MRRLILDAVPGGFVHNRIYIGNNWTTERSYDNPWKRDGMHFGIAFFKNCDFSRWSKLHLIWVSFHRSQMDETSRVCWLVSFNTLCDLRR